MNKNRVKYEKKDTAPDQGALAIAIKNVTRSFEEMKQLGEDREKELKGLGRNIGEIDTRVAGFDLKMNELMQDIVELKRAATLVQTPTGMLSPEDQAVKAAILGYVRRGDNGHDVDTKSLSSLAAPDGGYFVTADQNGRIVTRIREHSPLRQYANVQTITTGELEGVIDRDEADAGWTSEMAPRGDTGTPRVGKWKIPVHEMYANPKATQTLLDDAGIDVEMWLQNKIADRMARLEQYAFVLGNGAGKPKGFANYFGTSVVTADETRAFGKVQKMKTGGAGFKAAPDGGDVFIDLAMEMRPEYMTNAVWGMNRRTLAAVMKIKDSNGAYIWQPDFTKGAAGTILGAPVERGFDHMDAVGNGNYPVVLADFNEAYQIVDRQGVRILRDNLTAKPFVQFYTTRRVGGDVVNTDAIKVIQTSA